MTEWKLCRRCCFGTEGPCVRKADCASIRAEAEAKLAAAGRTAAEMYEELRAAKDDRISELEALNIKCKDCPEVKDAERQRDAAVMARDRDWHINDGKVAELEAINARQAGHIAALDKGVEKLMAEIKRLIASRERMMDSYERPERLRDFERQDDDGGDSGD